MLVLSRGILFAILLEITFIHPVHGEKDSIIPVADPMAIEALPDNGASERSKYIVNNTVGQDTVKRLGGTVTPSGNEIESAPLPAVDAPNSIGATKTAHSKPITIADSLGGNLPSILESRNGPYLVISDIFVPSGKSVTIEPGTIILFKDFTTLHVEGRLNAEGTIDRQIIFTSVLDQAHNPASDLRANPYDWNGIFIHENGLGSSLAYCTIQYSVYGVNSLTRYIKIDHVRFMNNGRADFAVEGTKHTVSDKPYSYALTISDAKKEGVPATIFSDPQAKKRNLLRYGGISLIVFGFTMGAWSFIQLNHDQENLDALSEKNVKDEYSPLVAKSKKDWITAYNARNRDRWIAILGFLCAASGSTGFVWSFRF